ncbi:S1C family serine protease [Caproiciproducens faecalis]|uniref:Trypsin-like peptidase domain-containing protein n=1 Tax=Caproiciproducens faecalis TaxID=2820301 RepID=A0ABS7DPP4_9FIRM|nr:trypsin-like peptidase domain-containing protein [Caproiciproducens faecalis]MBW7573089.1 trypsin-like peptidase domain-containing protein [Caproiciproducens faecalis]
MFNPFSDDEKNKNLTNHGLNSSDTEHQNENQTQWQGDYYRYSRPTNEPPVYSWEQPSVPQQPAVNFQEPRKKKRGGKKIFVKVLAGVMCCLMISAGSIAGFTALVNNGYIKFGTSTSDPAFTVTKLVNSGTTNTAAVTGELTKQQIAEKVVPSVVCIQNYQLGQSARYTMGGDTTGNAGGSNDDSAVTPTSEGSGIIATSDGYIITNAHVVEGASSLKVILSNGTKYEAKLIGSDSVTDLAVIKIDAKGLTAAEFGSSDDLKVADTVMAIGNPGGMEFNSSVTIGYVSALNREITNSETGYTMKCIQTDAAINPGNSGGALVNMYGQVIGINSSKIVATGYEGLGFSIPINVAQPIISDLKQYGYVKDRAVLGISGQFIDTMTSRFYNLPVGMYVGSVTNPAVTSAGIKKGDVITKIDGKDVTSQNVITGVITGKKPGDTVTLNVSNSLTGETFTAKVKLAQSTGK